MSRLIARRPRAETEADLDEAAVSAEEADVLSIRYGNNQTRAVAMGGE